MSRTFGNTFINNEGYVQVEKPGTALDITQRILHLTLAILLAKQTPEATFLKQMTVFGALQALTLAGRMRYPTALQQQPHSGSIKQDVSFHHALFCSATVLSCVIFLGNDENTPHDQVDMLKGGQIGALAFTFMAKLLTTIKLREHFLGATTPLGGFFSNKEPATCERFSAMVHSDIFELLTLFSLACSFGNAYDNNTLHVAFAVLAIACSSINLLAGVQQLAVFRRTLNQL